MTLDASPPPPRARRRNTDRSSETQMRLIEGTVDCLNRVGYASTSTIMVSDVSGVTRGGMVHHYSSKVDLIIATAEYCMVAMREERIARADGTGFTPQSPSTQGMMEIERGRYGVALTEIMMGSRSDEQLARRFKPVGDAILSLHKGAAERFAAQEGVEKVSDIEAMVWLTISAIRGMALMELAGMDPGLSDRALQIMDDNRRALVGRLTSPDSPKTTAPHDDG